VFTCVHDRTGVDLLRLPPPGQDEKDDDHEREDAEARDQPMGTGQGAAV
jgi:hypothetical protein